MNDVAAGSLDRLIQVDRVTERAICEMVRMIVRQKPTVRGVAHWDRGWGENLVEYRASGNLHSLKPKYIRSGLPLRQRGQFVIPYDPDYEWNWYRRFLGEIAGKWLADAGTICELGCGSGHNVAWLAGRFPDKLIVGADWSKASALIIEEMRRRGRANVEGRCLDFFGPPNSWNAKGWTFLTVGAMEQTGKNWQPMLDWFLSRKPKRVVHIEPLVEMYDVDNPVDLTAIEAHRARGFWEGYPDALDTLDREGRIIIEHVERAALGSLLTEGYSTVVWRPV